jgi:nucleoside-diphosphate-sugar epimerase
MEIERAAIVGATGPTGFHLAHELVRRGTDVRVVSRSAANLERVFTGLDVTRLEADAVDPAAMRDAIDGCDVVFDCVGLPADRMDLHPVTAAAITEAAASVGSRCVQVSSFWSYLPAADLPLDETSPREGGNHYIEMRRRAEDVFTSAGGAVLQLPDFFGPEVHTSTIQNQLQEAIDGHSINCIGSADTERDYVYVPDAMRVAADLAGHPEAGGRRWVIAGSGALSARRTAEMAGTHLGHRLKVRAAPPWLLRIFGLFSAELRAFMPMVRFYARPVSFNESALGELLGPIEHTPYEEAIPETLDWIAENRTD